MEKVVIKKWINGSFHVVAVYSSKDVKSITHHTDGLRIIFNGYVRIFDPQCVIEFRKDIVAEFKVGDWIITNDELVHKEYRVCRIEKIENDRYYINNGDFLAKNTLEEFDYHLWTIQDAKDGDVLVCNNVCPFIYKKSNDTKARLYCCVGIGNNFCVDDGIIYCGYKESAKPATQEQRDLLFFKIKEAGYEWDAEKKVLRKIEHEPTDKAEPKFKVGDWIVNKQNEIARINQIREDTHGTQRYHIEFNDGTKTYPRPCDADDDYHLWTINDAKDGDVLVAKIDKEPNDFIYIFKVHDQNGFSSYCYLDAYINKFHEGMYHNTHNVGVPATSEQRDFLFTKMKGAGYEWDGKVKKLKKIEQKPIWSEGDEVGFGDAMWVIKQARTIVKDENDMENVDMWMLIPELPKKVVSVDIAEGKDTPAMVIYKNGKVVKVKKGLDIV